MSNLHSKLSVPLEIHFSYMKSVHSAWHVWKEVMHVYMEEY